jgi:hypothetical protein
MRLAHEPEPPASAVTGQKGVHVTTAVTNNVGVDAVLSADVDGAPSAGGRIAEVPGVSSVVGPATGP